MIVLLVLISAFAGSCGVFKIITGDWQYLLSGNIAMGMMLCFTAIGHFRFSEGMSKMIPSFIPFKKGIVLLSGIFEIAAGLCLLVPQLRYETGLILLSFFVLILPANVHAAKQHLDYQTGTFDGKGLNYLWFRIPMQLFLMGWVWFFAIHHSYLN
jgi:uncharacterized membrane protein